jgi:hypothetical protein
MSIDWFDLNSYICDFNNEYPDICEEYSNCIDYIKNNNVDDKSKNAMCEFYLRYLEELNLMQDPDCEDHILDNATKAKINSKNALLLTEIGNYDIIKLLSLCAESYFK